MQQQTFTFKEIVEEKSDPDVDKKASPKIYTVSEIVLGVKGLLDKTCGDIWVTGEVSGHKLHASGHRYFTLKDAGAVLPAALFRGTGSNIKFAIEDGQELICHGKFSIYPKSGMYQLIVDYVEPKGVGALQLAFEQLKKKLEAEGLFAPARKRPLPYMPKKIGVVTSPTGAAFRDIVKVLRKRFPNIEVLLSPAKVQGEGSAEEIAEAISQLNARDDIDVMIVGRGGGSIEDLWAFNEEIVARAIFNSRIPVVSAVGHEVDFTIADFVADHRAPTPSAAAERVVPVWGDLVTAIQKARERLAVGLKIDVKRRHERLIDLKSRLAPPTRNFPDHYRFIDGLKERMTYSLQVAVNKKESSFRALAAELSHLSPLAILSKGYSVVSLKGKKSPIKSVKVLSVGQNLSVRLSEGTAEVKVTKIVD